MSPHWLLIPVSLYILQAFLVALAGLSSLQSRANDLTLLPAQQALYAETFQSGNQVLLLLSHVTAQRRQTLHQLLRRCVCLQHACCTCGMVWYSLVERPGGGPELGCCVLLLWAPPLWARSRCANW
jgi:hypothetical protein